MTNGWGIRGSILEPLHFPRNPLNKFWAFRSSLSRSLNLLRSWLTDPSTLLIESHDWIPTSMPNLHGPSVFPSLIQSWMRRWLALSWLSTSFGSFGFTLQVIFYITETSRPKEVFLLLKFLYLFLGSNCLGNRRIGEGDPRPWQIHVISLENEQSQDQKGWK